MHRHHLVPGQRRFLGGILIVRDILVSAVERRPPGRIPVMLNAGGYAPCGCQLKIAPGAGVNSVGDEAHPDVVASNNVKGTLSLSGVGRGASGIDSLKSERITTGRWQIEDSADRCRVAQFVIRVAQGSADRRRRHRLLAPIRHSQPKSRRSSRWPRRRPRRPRPGPRPRPGQPHVSDKVWHGLSGLRCGCAGAEIVDSIQVQEAACTDRVHDRLAAGCVLFGRHRRRKSIFEISSVSEQVDAGAAGIAADDVCLIRMQAETVDVEE